MPSGALTPEGERNATRGLWRRCFNSRAREGRDAMKTSPKPITCQALAATRIRAARVAAIDLLAAICDLMAERGIAWPSRTRITIRRTPYRPGVEIQT